MLADIPEQPQNGMDVDAEDEYNFIVYFDCTDESFPWPADVVKTIEERRVLMTDSLIFDILLSLGGVKHPDVLYPPRDVKALQRLLDAIEESTYDALKKDVLVYSLLKWHRDSRETVFAQQRCIPPQFVNLADAYWFLDAGEEVDRAVALLADARLNRDYTSKILQAIGLDANSHKLIRQYVRTAKPRLVEPDDIDAYSIALAESSLLEVWQYQRTFQEGSEMRNRILRNVLGWALTPKPRAKALTQLMAYQLTLYEESQLHTYVLNPPHDIPVSSIPVIQEFACLRLIQAGQFPAAVKLDRQLAISNIRGKSSDVARKSYQDRRQLMDDILATMPSAERRVLEAELDYLNPAMGGAVSVVMNGSTGDLSMSWESVQTTQSGTSSAKGKPRSQTNGSVVHAEEKQSRQQQKQPQQKNPEVKTFTPAAASPSPAPVPQSPQPVHTSPVPPIALRSGAPRFGGSPATSSPASASKPASSNFAAVREMFDNMAKQSPSPSSRQSQSQKQAQEDKEKEKEKEKEPRSPLSNKTTDPALESIAAPATGIPRGPSYTSPQDKGKAKAVQDAFPSFVTGLQSATRTPNAFYSPPAVAGVKRPLEDAEANPSSSKRRSPPPGTPSTVATQRIDMSAISAADVSAIFGIEILDDVRIEEEGHGQIIEVHSDEEEHMHEHEHEEEDVEMHEAEFTLPHIEPGDIPPPKTKQAQAHAELSDAEPEHEEEHEELDYSVFVPTKELPRTPAPRSKGKRQAVTVVSPPGAFMQHESDEEHEHDHEKSPEPEHERSPVPDMQLDELTTPPRRRTSRIPRAPPAAVPTPARLTRTRSAQMEAKLMRSIPGAFLDEIEEETDASSMPPPPPPHLTEPTGPHPSASTAPAASSSRQTTATPARKRTSTATATSRKTRAKDAQTPSRPTRRSSRLSHMSAESESEEATEHEKVTMTTRKRKPVRKSTAATEEGSSAGTSHATSAGTTSHATRSTRTRKHR